MQTSVFQVKRVLDALYENKKIASATHNIYAYRYGMIGGLGFTNPLMHMHRKTN